MATQLPDHSWAHEPTFHVAVRQRVLNLRNHLGQIIKLQTPFDDEAFIQRLLKDARTHGISHDDMCSAFSHVVNERTKLSHEIAGTEGVASLSAARAVKTGAIDLNTITVDEILDAHKVTASPTPRVTQAKRDAGQPPPKPHSNLVDPETRAANRLSSNQKFWGSASLAMAALMTLGTVSNAKQIFREDDKGQSQVQWSPLLITLLTGALAAFTAYTGVQQLRGRMV